MRGPARRAAALLATAALPVAVVVPLATSARAAPDRIQQGPIGGSGGGGSNHVPPGGTSGSAADPARATVTSGLPVSTCANATPANPQGFNVIVGTSRSDILNGTPGPDAIFGLGGNDAINGNAADGGPGHNACMNPSRGQPGATNC